MEFRKQSNIILCGLPACGKTTIGKKLATSLKWNFIDTDKLIEQAYFPEKKISCRQIYTQEGETLFRKLEKHHIASLKSAKKTIISIGGGALNDPENRTILLSIGCLIYLKTETDIVWKRLRKRGQPAYLDLNNPEQAFYKLVEARIPLYEQAATLTVETKNMSKQEIVFKILNYRGAIGEAISGN